MEKDEWFFWGIIAFIGGVFYGSFFSFFPGSFLLLSGAFLCAAAFSFRSALPVYCGIFLFLFSGGTILSSQEMDRYRMLSEPAGPVSGIARVVADPVEKDFFRNIILRFDECTEGSCPETDVLWQAPLSFREQAGTRIAFRCTLELPKNFTPEFDYRMFLAKAGIGYRCDRADSITVLEPDWESGARAALYRPKHIFEYALSQALREPEAGLAKGLLLGGDDHLPRDLKESFTRVGLSHMIAVSGYNITLIAEMLLIVGLALGLWRRQAVWSALVGIVFFVVMIGLPASAARAGAMASIVFFAFQSGRLARPANALLFAGGAMLLFNPLLLRYDLGFQLSFLATLGILLIVPYYERFAPKQVVWKKIGEVLVMTVAAELFVLPLILFSFHTFSPLIILGNFLVLLVPFAMAGSFLAALLFLVLPGAEVVLAWGSLVALTILTRSVEYLGGFDHASILIEQFGVWHLVGWYVILGLGMVFISKRFPHFSYAFREKI